MLLHTGVLCDGCGQIPIVGVRYKCTECSDFDFCRNCYSIKCCHEAGHRFIKRVRGEHRSHEKTYVQCDGCVKMPMVGMYYSCKECKEFDLCRKCYKIVEHTQIHKFEKVRRPSAPQLHHPRDHQVQRPRDKKPDAKQVYEMPKEKGYFLVFSNGKFPRHSGCSDLSRRNKENVKALIEVFGELLEFEIRTFVDTEETEIMCTLNHYACKDHSAYECFGCIFLSHGGNGVVYDRRGKVVPFRKIFEKFRGRNMRSIPKLFFFDLCRSVRAPSEPVVDCGFNALSVYAYSEGSDSHCTTYTTTLCDVIRDRYLKGLKRDIMEILRVVNQRMEKESKRGEFQCPALTSTLTQRLFLWQTDD